MKKLIFQDTEANKCSYYLLLPNAAEHWTLAHCLTYLKAQPGKRRNKLWSGILMTEFRYESFKLLLSAPEKTLNEKLTFFQNGKKLTPKSRLNLTNDTTIIEIGRIKNSEIDLSILNIKARNKNAFTNCRKSVIKIIDDLFDFKQYKITNLKQNTINSFAEICDKFNEELDKKNQLRFLVRLAQIIYASPFENIGRIAESIPFYSGLEMWARIEQGLGGVCAEKTSALKFICDIIDIETTPVFGSRAAMPDNLDQLFFDYIKSGGNREMPIQVQHLLLLLTIEDDEFLVDITNGNIPFLFLHGEDIINRMNGKMRARMVYHSDSFYLKKVPTIIGDAILTISEFHIPDLYYQYIFKQQLGLHITSHAYLGVYFDWGGERSQLMQNYYSAKAKSLKLPYPLFIHENNVDSLTDENMKNLLKELDKSLMKLYKYKHYTGGFTFIIQPLHQYQLNNWQLSDYVKTAIHDFKAE